MRSSLKIIGYMMAIAVLAVLVIFFDEIKELLLDAMMAPAESMVDQLLR